MIQIIGKNTGAYLANLEKEYSLINRNKPMFSKPESRNSRWCLNDNYLMFWFRFIFPNLSMIELGKNNMLEQFILKNYEQYSGRILERYFRDMIAESEDITDIGNYWDNKGENEIDLISPQPIREQGVNSRSQTKFSQGKYSPPIRKGCQQ